MKKIIIILALALLGASAKANTNIDNVTDNGYYNSDGEWEWHNLTYTPVICCGEKNGVVTVSYKGNYYGFYGDGFANKANQIIYVAFVNDTIVDAIQF